MKRGLQHVAAVLLVSSLAWWWGAGANRGWTKTSVPVTFVDDVTGIEGVRYEERVVPGLDVLGGTGVLAALLFGGSCFFRPRTSTNRKPR